MSLRAIYVGHSIPKRFDDYLAKINMWPEDYLEVSNFYAYIDITAIPGLKVTEPAKMNFVFKSCTSVNYDVVIVDIGCNYLAAGVSPLKLLTEMVKFVEALVENNRTVIVLSVIPRAKSKYNFEDHALFPKIKWYNYIMWKYCKTEKFVHFHQQKGYFQKTLWDTTYDAIHPKISRRAPYCQNLRRALFNAVKWLPSNHFVSTSHMETVLVA